MRGRVSIYILALLTGLQPDLVLAKLNDVCLTHNTFKADDGPCPKEFPFFTKKKSCVDACKRATEGAVWARLVCQDHIPLDEQLIKEGEKASEEAAKNTEQKQNANETSNAVNMTAGERIQQQRKANAESLVPVFTMCIMLGVKCDQEGGNGVPVDMSCQNALQALNNEIANLSSSAKQMEKKSEKSTKNAETLENKNTNTKLTGTGLTGSGKSEISATEAAADSDITVPNGSTVGMTPVDSGAAEANSGASSFPGAGATSASGRGSAAGSGSAAGAGGLGKGGGSGFGMQSGNLGLTGDISEADGSGKSADSMWNMAGGKGFGAPSGSGSSTDANGWLNPNAKDGAGGGSMVNLGGAGGKDKKGDDATRGLANTKGSLNQNGANMTIFEIMHRRYGRLRSDGQI